MDYTRKSSVEEIRERFDNDVERFSSLETGQAAMIDAKLLLELLTAAAAKVNANAKHLLDIGCGAGNFTLQFLRQRAVFEITLIDLSQPMLRRAEERIRAAAEVQVHPLQGDIREVPLPTNSYDVVLAASTLHHLRGDSEWQQVFTKIFQALRPGGSFWISDLVLHDHPAIQALMRERYAAYLEELGGTEYREKVFAYIEEEDTPRSVLYQVDLLREVGFREVEILHKNSWFAAFGGIKPSSETTEAPPPKASG